MKSKIKPILWENHRLKIIDQTLLPGTLKYIDIERMDEVKDAIKQLKIRGAPALGIFSAFALCAVLYNSELCNTEEAISLLSISAVEIKQTRPTAVNLFWATDRMLSCAQLNKEKKLDVFLNSLENEAIKIYKEETEACKKIGIFGNQLISDSSTVLTHCNAGALATGEYGTALSPIYVAHEQGKKIHVYADETRPLLQGARLTAWELQYSGVPVTLICDNMAGQVMKEKKVDFVIVGADRIAKNGDTANKIGTYSLSILAKYHGVPFYVSAPTSTFDMDISSGSQITIEQRDKKEIYMLKNEIIAPDSIMFYNPAFDVTPADNITAFITEKGLIYPPFEENIPKILLKS